MINIAYSSVPQEYLDFIDRFKKKLEKWCNKNEMGVGKTKIAIDAQCMKIFKKLTLSDNLKNFLLTPAADLPDLIDKIETDYPVLRNDRIKPSATHSSLYICLSKAFDSLGYCDSQFPDYALTKALEIKACPYCNAEDLVAKKLISEGIHIKNSELDHFYPRNLFPYLSISLYNLIPSGSICNGGNCKHDKDTYQKGLVNPFSLSNSNGVVFELDIVDKGLLSYRTFRKACSIKTKVVDSLLGTNMKLFLIESRYEQEIDYVRVLWCKFRECASKGYQSMIEEKAKLLNTTLTFEEWFMLETHIDPYNYNNRKLSKLTMDIWWQLDAMKC